MYLHLKYKKKTYLYGYVRPFYKQNFEKEDLYDTDLELCIEGGKYRQTFILLVKIILNGFEWFSFQEMIIVSLVASFVFSFALLLNTKYKY